MDLSRYFYGWLANLFASLALLGLGACAWSTPLPPAAPTAPVVMVALSPPVLHLDQALQTCAAAHPEFVLFVAPESGSPPPDGLSFRLGSPVDMPPFSAPLGAEQIVIIVHPSNPLANLSRAEALSLFMGQIVRWDVLGGPVQPVQVWLYPEQEDTRRAFEGALGAEAGSSSHAYLAPGPAEMLEAVAADPGAIGYLPAAFLDETVKALELEPDLVQALQQPLLALAAREPQGPARVLLGCLQSGPGQDRLRESYLPWTLPPSP